jgi:hypothetical protein
MEEVEMTETESIARDYKSMLESVALINQEVPAGIPVEDWAERVGLHKAHLRIMLTRDFWTGEDMTSIHAAIN